MIFLLAHLRARPKLQRQVQRIKLVTYYYKGEESDLLSASCQTHATTERELKSCDSVKSVLDLFIFLNFMHF